MKGGPVRAHASNLLAGAGAALVGFGVQGLVGPLGALAISGALFALYRLQAE